MKPKFKDKYRIESIRLPNRDYAANGWYFVTICTHERQWFFGDVIEGKVRLSEIGQIAQQYWVDIPSHFEYIYVDAYVIMPNHVHGIVVIDKPHNIETSHGAFLHQNQTQATDQSNKFAPLKRGSLQVIINAYKSSVTRWCRKNGQEHFGWQTRFYEHIIRADGSLDEIREYIINNPLKWEHDKNNPADLWM
jgi:putative transposase